MPLGEIFISPRKPFGSAVKTELSLRIFAKWVDDGLLRMRRLKLISFVWPTSSPRRRDTADAKQLKSGSVTTELISIGRLAKCISTRIITLGSLKHLLPRRKQVIQKSRSPAPSHAFQHRLRRADRSIQILPLEFQALRFPIQISRSGNGRDQHTPLSELTSRCGGSPDAMIRKPRGISETESMIAAARSELRYRVEDAWHRAKTASGNLFETRLIPDAQQAYDVTLAGYSCRNLTQTLWSLQDCRLSPACQEPSPGRQGDRQLARAAGIR